MRYEYDFEYVYPLNCGVPMNGNMMALAGKVFTINNRRTYGDGLARYGITGLQWTYVDRMLRKESDAAYKLIEDESPIFKRLTEEDMKLYLDYEERNGWIYSKTSAGNILLEKSPERKVITKIS